MTNRVLRAGAAAILSAALLQIGPFAAFTPFQGRAVAQSSDPFYTSLLQNGELEFDQGHTAAAAKDLRIACFGMLDLPPLLARCLVRLAVAQGAIGDTEGFRETFARLMDLESRAPAYAQAAVPTPVRDSFERLVVQRIPAGTLAASPTFQALTGKKPDTGKKKGSRERSAPAPAPPPPAAQPATPAPLTASAKPGIATPTAAAPKTASAASAASAPIANSAPAKAPAPSVAAAPEPHAAAAPPPAAEPQAPLSAADKAALAAARDQLRGAKTAADLQVAGTTAQTIAEAHPGVVEASTLAGEIAYRSSRWKDAVTYLRRAGPPADQPLLGFYLAVSQFETGDRQAAAATLRPLLKQLQRTPYVQGYVAKILPGEVTLP